jgi:feruloyl esterase
MICGTGERGMRLVLPAMLALLLGPASAHSQAPDGCGALLARSFRDLPDAPTVLVSATVVAGADDLPAHCRVQGHVAPQVNFELQLPLAPAWNGKLLMQGCGGMCGSVQPATCADALARNYAVVTTDMGHSGKAWEALWAYDNLPAEIDFAYRATHVVAVAAKAVVTAYYQRPAARAYFRGCSTGGRQGLVEAQRFPGDFDGIIAGAPVFDETGVAALHLIWSGRANLDAAGTPLLSPADVGRLHEAALAACDAADGRRDRIIEDPSRCDFDPARLRCGVRPAGECLGEAQVAAARRLYGGAVNSAGVKLTPGGLMPGSEYEWVPNFVGRDGPAVFDPAGGVSQLYQYLIFMPDPGPGHGAAEFDFDRDPPRLALMETLYTARNPDLRAFRDRGGKLLLYHGWDDAEIPPLYAIDYFKAVERSMGGASAVAAFMRLYMMPGVAHCRRGPGADTVDWLTYLERWVEQGEAPEEVTAHHLTREQDYLGLPRPRFPLPAGDYDWTRPLRPYGNP